MTQTRYSAAEFERKVTELHNGGFVPRGISTRLGVTPKMVDNCLSALGLSPNVTPEKASIARKSQISQLHAEGLTNDQIAAKVGITVAAVGNRLGKLRLTPNKPVPKAPRSIVVPTPWDDLGAARHETAPRSASYMVGEKWMPEPDEGDDMREAAIVSAIMAVHQGATA